MIRKFLIQRIRTMCSGLPDALEKICVSVWRFLTFSLADERIARKKSFCICIEWGSLSVAFAERFLSRLKIISCRRYDLGKDGFPSPEDLSSVSSRWVNDFPVSNAEITLSIPKAWCVVQAVEFPPAARDHLADAISYEIDRLTPFDQGEACYDFQIVKEENGKLFVMVLAARAGLIDSCIRALKDKGVSVNRVTVNHSEMAAFLDHCLKEKDLIAVAAPSEELRRVSLGLLKNHGNPSEIPYPAAGCAIESLLPKRKERRINLLSGGRHPASKSPLRLTGLLLVCILVLGITYLASPVRLEEKKVEEIDRQIRIRKEEVKKAEALKKEMDLLEREISVIDEYKSKGPMALALLKELTAVLPKSVWLERVKITETTVDIEGYAASASQILSQLEASSYFQKAEFASAIVKNARTNSDRFTIKMEIKGVKKMETGKTGNEKKK